MRQSGLAETKNFLCIDICVLIYNLTAPQSLVSPLNLGRETCTTPRPWKCHRNSSWHKNLFVIIRLTETASSLPLTYWKRAPLYVHNEEQLSRELADNKDSQVLNREPGTSSGQVRHRLYLPLAPQTYTNKIETSVMMAHPINLRVSSGNKN